MSTVRTKVLSARRAIQANAALPTTKPEYRFSSGRTFQRPIDKPGETYRWARDIEPDDTDS